MIPVALVVAACVVALWLGAGLPILHEWLRKRSQSRTAGSQSKRDAR